MHVNQPIATILAWHDALNTGDVNRVVSLVDANVEMGGPRGTVSGVSALREWTEQSGIHLQPCRVFHRDDRVVVEQHASWRIAETGQMTEPDLVASAFVVRDDRIVSVIRYPDLETAIEAADLSAEDEASVPDDR